MQLPNTQQIHRNPCTNPACHTNSTHFVSISEFRTPKGSSRFLNEFEVSVCALDRWNKSCARFYFLFGVLDVVFAVTVFGVVLTRGVALLAEAAGCLLVTVGCLAVPTAAVAVGADALLFFSAVVDDDASVAAFLGVADSAVDVFFFVGAGAEGEAVFGVDSRVAGVGFGVATAAAATGRGLVVFFAALAPATAAVLALGEGTRTEENTERAAAGAAAAEAAGVVAARRGAFKT